MNTLRLIGGIVAVPLGTAVFAWLVLTLAAPWLARRLMFHPPREAPPVPSGVRELKTSEGGTVAVLHLPNPPARFTLWYFHGNAETLGTCEAWLREVHRAGFAVFAVEYPGYGLTTGQPSEESIYAANRVARDYLRHELRVPAAQTILYGNSLGGGPAVQAATEEAVAGLVLQGAFMSAYRVKTHWPIVPFDQFRNLAKLPALRCPVLVMHGRDDDVIPFAHGRALHDAVRGPRRHLWVEGAGHNNLINVAGESYWRVLREFAELCARPNAAAP
ncbi:MAG: alpha/beta hydrolase [Opitutaceae bacterium]|nr:alpha/beta hydrolase [Opitutaceae bacterium]